MKAQETSRFLVFSKFVTQARKETYLSVLYVICNNFAILIFFIKPYYSPNEKVEQLIQILIENYYPTVLNKNLNTKHAAWNKSVSKKFIKILAKSLNTYYSL